MRARPGIGDRIVHFERIQNGCIDATNRRSTDDVDLPVGPNGRSLSITSRRHGRDRGARTARARVVRRAGPRVRSRIVDLDQINRLAPICADKAAEGVDLTAGPGDTGTTAPRGWRSS